MDVMMAPGTVKLRVPELLEAKGWTITEFMRNSGLSYPTAHRLAHHDVTAISLETLDILCEVFGVGIDELIVRLEEEE